MTNETRKFKIAVIIILAVTILWTACISVAFFWHTKAETERREGQGFGIYVCGTPVQFRNASDVLGDGTVMYDPSANMLMLTDATLESDGSAAIFAEKDVTIVLNGENKIICKGQGTTTGIYASDYMLRKDISIMGSGTLTIEGNGEGVNTIAAIVADDIWAYSNISVSLSDVAAESAGIECSFLALLGENTVSVDLDSVGESSGIYVGGNAVMFEKSTLDVSVTCAGNEDRGIECTGSFTAGEGSTIYSSAGEDGRGILCHNTFFNEGAAVNCEIEAIDGIRHETD